MSLSRLNKSTWTNNNDTEMMRSLEKVAREKGLIKEDHLQKTAATAAAAHELDLKPSDNLLQNILNLCAGLRASGFDKYASELETSYLNYKQALYNTDPKAGEKMLHDAHPEGSHKLEGVEGGEYAVIEDILDEHLRLLNIVNKTPNGKLTSANDVLRAVKKALGAPSNKANGSALKNVLGQESNIGAEVGGTVAGLGGVALLKFVYNKLKDYNALDSKTIRMVEEQLGKKLTSVQADGIRKQVVDRISKDTLEKVFGDKTLKTVTETAAKGVTKIPSAGVELAEQSVAKAVPQAAKGAGAWGRLTSLLGRGAAAGAQLGAVEVGGGALGVGASIVAAALIGVAVSGGGTWILFNKYQEPKKIKDAGDFLIESADNLANELPVEAKKAVIDFKTYYDQVLAYYSVIEELEANKNPNDLLKLKALNDALMKSNAQAQIIWAYAQDKVEKGSWYNPRGIFGGGWSGLVTKSNNYMIRSMERSNIIDKLVYELNAKIETELKKKENTIPGTKIVSADAAKVLQGYTDIINIIPQYKEKVTILALPNAAKINKNLDNMLVKVTENRAKFNALLPENKSDPKILNMFTENVSEYKSILDDFKAKRLS